MKLRFIANFAPVAALAVVLPLGMSSARAVSSGAVPLSGDSVVEASQFQRVEWTEARKDKLRRAYWLLEHSDADYAGHRVKAMDHIKKAGDILGMDLHGKGFEQEGQGKSDEKMRRARTLLREVAADSGGHELERVRDAIHEIDHALEVR